MLTHILLLLADDSVSFCGAAPAPVPGAGSTVPLAALEDALRFAAERGVTVNALYPAYPVHAALEASLEKAGAVRIVPPALAERFPDAVVVGSPAALRTLAPRTDDRNRNVVLCLPRAELPDLAEVAIALGGRHARVNVQLADLELYTDDDLALYRVQLERVARWLLDRLVAEEAAEVSCLTDRMLLREHNGCDAGLRHLTLAPDGRWYVCPGYYRAGLPAEGDTAEAALGRLAARPMAAGASPLCAACDAFQCRRCVYLNRHATLEERVAPRQQCVAAHIERKVAGDLLEELQCRGRLLQCEPVSRLKYMDPMDTARSKERMAAQ